MIILFVFLAIDRDAMEIIWLVCFSLSVDRDAIFGAVSLQFLMAS